MFTRLLHHDGPLWAVTLLCRYLCMSKSARLLGVPRLSATKIQTFVNIARKSLKSFLAFSYRTPCKVW